MGPVKIVTPTRLGEFVRSWLLCGPFPCATGEPDAVRRAAHDADLLAGIVGRVVADCEPAFVRDEAGAEVVILSAADFSAWQETVYLLSSPANAAHLQASLRQAKGGKHANAGCHDHKLTSMRPGPPAGWRSA